MKNFKTTKKLLSVVLCVLMVFSTISVAAAETQTEEKTVCKNNEHVLGEYVGEIIEATCKKEGLETYQCSECDEIIEMIIPKTGHQFDDDTWVTIIDGEHSVANISKGRRRNFCRHCGEMAVEDFDIPHEYADGDLGEVKRQPTCVKEGELIIRCTLCDKNQSIAIPVNSDAHKFGEVYFTGTIPTCKEPGSGVRVCEYCDYVLFVEDVYAKNAYEAHSLLPWVIDQDAETDDPNTVFVYKECSGCKKNIETVEIKKHDLVDPKGVASTCTDFGYAEGFCKICNDKVDQHTLIIDFNNHDWMEDIVVEEATCEENGRILRRCARNRAHAELITIEDDEHTLDGKWTVTKEATCNVAGEKETTCTVCGEKVVETIPVDESLHIFNEDNSVKIVEEAPADLEKIDYCKLKVTEKSSCITCGKYMEKNYLNHNYVEERVINATCSDTGSVIYRCSRCSTVKTVILPVDESKHVASTSYTTVTYPTCTTEGVKAAICKICRKADMSVTKKIPVTSHTATDWVPKEIPNCDKGGSSVRSCTKCNLKVTMNIAASHFYTDWAYEEVEEGLELDCMTPIKRTRICYVCREPDSEDYYIGHAPGSYNFISGSCAVGGTVEVFCEYCQERYDAYDVSAGEHVLNTAEPIELEYNIEEFCGGKAYKCFICDSVVEITARHSYRHIPSDIEACDPTCVLPGLTGRKQCMDCFYVLDQKIILPTGHDFKWGLNGEIYCKNCGEYYIGDNTDTDKDEDEDTDSDLDNFKPEYITCKHFCHNQGVTAKILLKVLTIFWKMFGIKQVCDCGVAHYEVKTKK